jgi:hypothetical protein
MVVWDFNIPLSPIDRSSKQKINEEILELNDTINQKDLADVYRIFHSTTAQYTFFSAAPGTFPKIDHILGHKASLSKYEKIEIAPWILSDHNALKLEFNNKNNCRKHSYNLKLNNILLIDQYVIAEIRKETFWKVMKIKTQPTWTYGTQQRQS